MEKLLLGIIQFSISPGEKVVALLCCVEGEGSQTRAARCLFRGGAKRRERVYLLFLHIVDPRIDPAKCILKIRFDFILTEHSITYQPFLKRKRNFGHLAHWIVIITPSLSLSLSSG